MKLTAHILLGIVVTVLANIGPTQASKSGPFIEDSKSIHGSKNLDSVVFNQDYPGDVANIHSVGKAEFLEQLHGKQSMLLNFYEDGNEESDMALKVFEAFAKRAASRYPGLYVGRVNTKASPYLTARLLLTEIPELRLIIKDEEGKWIAYSPEPPENADELVEYMDSQRWYLAEPLGGRRQLYCSPFNFCGRALAAIAETGDLVDQYIPLPKWLAVILVPALITFAGRFIIQGMYAAEEQIRALFHARQRLVATPRDENDDLVSDRSKAQDTERRKNLKTR
ncbi:hypothetical protein GGI11_007292 [Coemansia sp. RSA 2049]|nr:hypothetical protein GGI11_007292 [Coemansia sp. RSA 2049]